MSDGSESTEQSLESRVQAAADRIYSSYLPDYLRESWERGRGAWHEECLREQLDSLVIAEIWGDPARLVSLEGIEDWVALVFGTFGTTSRILDHIGMHLRGQTFGQYELLAEDVALLRELCQRFLKREPPQLTLFS